MEEEVCEIVPASEVQGGAAAGAGAGLLSANALRAQQFQARLSQQQGLGIGGNQQGRLAAGELSGDDEQYEYGTPAAPVIGISAAASGAGGVAAAEARQCQIVTEEVCEVVTDEARSYDCLRATFLCVITLFCDFFRFARPWSRRNAENRFPRSNAGR